MDGDLSPRCSRPSRRCDFYGGERSSTRNTTGVVLFGVSEYQWSLELVNPVILGPGTFWVEIFNNSGFGTDDVFWETGDLDPVNGRDGGAGAFETPGVIWGNLGAGTNLAMQLIPRFTLTVDKAGAGTGTVTSEPAGILCGGDCTEDYVENTVVTLAAHPGVKSYFVGWSEDCSGTGLTAQVTLDADRTCIATFGYPVGGIVVPVDKVGLLAPWMRLVALAGLAALGVVVVRRRRS